MSHYRTIQALGTPIVINSGVTKMLGSMNASALLGHIMYWSDKTDNPLGFYRTLDGLCDETGLTKDELKTARKILVDKGIVTEEYKRLEHKLYFKFNNTVFDEQFEAYLATLEKPISRNGDFQFGESQNPTFGEGEIPLSLVNKITTKITSESESKNSHTQNPNLETSPQEKIQNLNELENPTPQETFEFLKSSLVFGSDHGIISERMPNLAEITALTAEVTAYWSTKNFTKQQILAKILGSISRLGAMERIEKYTLAQVNANAQPTAEAPVINPQYKSVSPFERLMGNA